MATKDGLLFLNGKQKQTFVNSSSNSDNHQYSNLNLNQNQKCLSEAAVTSSGSLKSNSFNERNSNFDITDNNINSNDSQAKNGLNSLNKSSKTLSHGMNLRNSEKQQKNKINSNKNSSTLSLHIAAYENSIESGNQNNSETVTLKQKSKQSTSGKTSKKVKQFLAVSKPQIQNPFELPRQQSDQITKPEVMQFKASQRLLKPNEFVFNDPITITMEVNKDDMFDSMADVIYMLTAQPLVYQKLSLYYAFCGQPFDLEETCKIFGYKSFNHFVRENQKLFAKFLEIYVSKSSSKNEFVLYYQNRDIKNKGMVLEHLQDKSIEEGHVQINIDETIYFETHNDLQYLEGRRKLAQAVNYCEETRNVNDDGFVQMEHIQIAFRELHNEEYSKSVLKALFPNQGGKMEQILQSICFEEIGYHFSTEKQCLQLHMKKGTTIQKITEKLNKLERQIKPFLDNLVQQILKDTNSRRTSYRPQKQQQQPYPSAAAANRFPVANIQKKEAGSSSKRIPTVFGDSDSEDDLRAENRKHHVFQKASVNDDGIVGDEGMADDTLQKVPPKPASPKIKTLADFVQKFTVLDDDVDMNELYDDEDFKDAEDQVPEVDRLTQQVIITKVEEKVETLKISDSNVAKIAAKSFVAVEIVPTTGLAGAFLNPSTKSYDDEDAYTDREDGGEEEKNGNSSYSSSSSTKNDSPLPSSIAAKPTPLDAAAATAAVKANQKKCGKSGNFSSSSSSESDDDDESETLSLGDDLLSHSDMSSSNNKSPNENSSHGRGEESKSPSHNAGGSGTQSNSNINNTQPQVPRKFEYLLGRLPRSSECSKFKKEEHRRERERSNGTHLKKTTKINHVLPSAPGTRNPATTTTAAASGVLNDSNRTRTSAASIPTPAASESRQRVSQSEARTNTAAASTRTTPPLNNSQNPLHRPEASNVHRDSTRHPLPSTGSNASTDPNRARNAAGPTIPERRSRGEPRTSNRAHERTESPLFVPVSKGGFSIPYNYPGTVRNDPPPTEPAAPVRPPTENRQNPDRAEHRRRENPQQPIVRPIPSHPVSPLHPDGGHRAAPHVPHHAETYFQGEVEHPVIDNHGPPPGNLHSRDRQVSQNSMDSSNNNAQRRPRPRHDYAARPATALPPEYGNHHHQQQQRHGSVASDAEFHSISQPRRSFNEFDETDERYYNNRQQQQPRHHQQQQNNFENDAYRGTPQPTRNEYPPPQHPVPPPQDYPYNQAYPDQRDLPPPPQEHYQRSHPQQPPPMYHPHQQDLPHPPPPPPYYRGDDRTHYATPVRQNGFQPVNPPEQHYQQPRHAQQQQGNYYAHSDNGYNSRERFDSRSSAIYQQSRPVSAFPQSSTSSFHGNSIPRSGSSLNGNPADYRNASDGSRSVVPLGLRLRQPAAATDNEVNAVIQQIRIVMTATEGFCKIQKIAQALTAANLPSHPQNITGLNNIDTWDAFVYEYLRDDFVYHEFDGEKFILDPRKCEPC